MAEFDWLSEMAGLATPLDRTQTATRLAWQLGAEELVVFLKDTEIGILLPAPGFVQTLPGIKIWQEFLSRCIQQPFGTENLPWPTIHETRSAIGITAADEVALVLLGGTPDHAQLARVALLLPLLGKSLRWEYEARLAEARAATEREAAAEAASLNAALDMANRDLQRAFQEIGELNERLRRLIVETHHRVKNNLQVLGAMVDLQLLGHTESIPVEELQRIQTYIRTLSNLHDLLTQTSKAGHLEASAAVHPILERLITMLQQTIPQEIRYSLTDTVLPVKQVTSLALLLNELTSNAIKHGQGSIGISFSVSAMEASLIVEDDGPGFPPGFDPEQSGNTGMGLILSFAEFDLGGSVRFETRAEGGGRISVTFPINPFL